jgi:hypothetical protein
MEFSNMMHQCKFPWRAVNAGVVDALVKVRNTRVFTNAGALSFHLHQSYFAGNFSA